MRYCDLPTVPPMCALVVESIVRRHQGRGRNLTVIRDVRRSMALQSWPDKRERKAVYALAVQLHKICAFFACPE